MTTTSTTDVMLTPPAPVALSASANGEAAPEQSGSVFSWESVSYGVGAGAKSKEILTENSGFVQGGELCAIVGPSGSGKTSTLVGIGECTEADQYGIMYKLHDHMSEFFGKTLSAYTIQGDATPARACSPTTGAHC